jgi:hypothetical protein
MRQASPGSFPQNLPFELGEDGQQAGHRSTGRGGQVKCLSQGNETDAQVLQFLEGCQQIGYRAAPAIQTPDQHHIDLPSVSGFQ